MAYSILENSIQVITFFRVDISEVNYATCRYIIDNNTDTFSIVNYLQNHCLWRKNGQKLVLYYLENPKLPTKSSFVEKKRSKLVLYYPENHRNSHLGKPCAVFTSETNFPPGCRLVLMPFNIRVTSCRYELAVIFMCRLCIDIAMSEQSTCLSFRDYSDNR